MHFTDVWYHANCHPVIHCRVPVFRMSGLQDFEATHQRWYVYDFYFNIIVILNVSQDLTIKLVIYIFQRYLTKIAENSNIDSKLQIILLLFLGWVGMEDIRKGCFCWLNKDQNDRGIN